MTTAVKSPICPLHGLMIWVECWQCNGDRMIDHDCGEDFCVCDDPEPNVRCDICNGKGGWYRCYTCASETAEELAGQ